MDAASYLLLVTLIRNGTLEQGEAEAMARQLDHDGEPDAAHVVRSAIIEAAAGDPADWHRAQIKSADIVHIPFYDMPRPDGGNSDPA